MHYVQHEEHELEQKRSHCKLLVAYRSSVSISVWPLTVLADIKVVEAFKSALQLLGT